MSKFLTAPQWYDAGGGLNKSLDVNCNGSDTATAFGNGANASNNSVAIGNGSATGVGGGCISIGRGSKANGTGSVAIGVRAETGLGNTDCIAIGWEAKCSGVASEPSRTIQFLSRDVIPTIRTDLIGFGKKSLLDLIYPVGSIYISVSSENPGTIFGGTWEAFATGKTLVGVDANDTDFNVAGNAGGSKASSLPRHSHSFERAVREHAPVAAYLYQRLDGNTSQPVGAALESNQVIVPEASLTELPDTYSGKYLISSEGNSDVSKGNMPPYITVYMWKRTA